MINSIGKAKKRRIKTYGSDNEFFAELWQEREHICKVCDYKIYRMVRDIFSHIYSKGAHPKLRYHPGNVEIWCASIVRNDEKPGCHDLWHNNRTKFWERADKHGWQKPELQYLLSLNIN